MQGNNPSDDQPTTTGRRTSVQFCSGPKQSKPNKNGEQRKLMRTTIKRRSRSTRHARLKRNNAVRQKISDLIRVWDIVDAATRGERLRELIGLGCRRRGLATDIGVSATSIRFHLDLTELSPAQTELVRNGGSARDAFIAIQEQRAESARFERLRQERETAVVSDQLANDTARFCLGPHRWRSTEEPVGLCEPDIEMFWLDLSGWMRMYRHDRPLTPSPASVRLKFDAISQLVGQTRRNLNSGLAGLQNGSRSLC